MTTPAQRRPAEEPWASSFDVREYARTASGSHREGLDLPRFDDRPLTPKTLHYLRYLRHVERSTVRYLRRVLVTPAHKDARITAFLTTWAFEKYWVADLLSAILEHHERQVTDAAPATAASPNPAPPAAGPKLAGRWRRIRDGLAPIGRSVVSNSIGERVVGVHMAAGAVDEHLSLVAYDRVDQLAEHPELSSAIYTVKRVKARHLEFFEAQARARLDRSELTRSLTRASLRRSRWPVSGERQPDTGRGGVLRQLFSDVPGLVEQADRRVQQLPGLGRLTILRATVASVT